MARSSCIDAGASDLSKAAVADGGCGSGAGVGVVGAARVMNGRVIGVIGADADSPCGCCYSRCSRLSQMLSVTGWNLG